MKSSKRDFVSALWLICIANSPNSMLCIIRREISCKFHRVCELPPPRKLAFIVRLSEKCIRWVQSKQHDDEASARHTQRIRCRRRTSSSPVVIVTHIKIWKRKWLHVVAEKEENVYTSMNKCFNNLFEGERNFCENFKSRLAFVNSSTLRTNWNAKHLKQKLKWITNIRWADGCKLEVGTMQNY